MGKGGRGGARWGVGWGGGLDGGGGCSCMKMTCQKLWIWQSCIIRFSRGAFVP